MFRRIGNNILKKHHFSKVVTNTSVPFSMDAGSGFTYPAPRKLEGVVNMEMFATQPIDLISTIWTEHHAQSATSMASVIPAKDFELLQKRATNTPFFVVPIQRDGGYFVLLSQFQDKSFLMTYLDDYRKNPASAQPYLCITAYDELALTHDAVLLRADICALATLSKSDAERILGQIVKMYIQDEHYQQIYNFNKDTEKFDMDKALETMNSL